MGRLTRTALVTSFPTEDRMMGMEGDSIRTLLGPSPFIVSVLSLIVSIEVECRTDRSATVFKLLLVGRDVVVSTDDRWSCVDSRAHLLDVQSLVQLPGDTARPDRVR